MPDIVLSTFSILNPVIFATLVRGRYYYHYSYFTDEDGDWSIATSTNLPKATQLVSGRAQVQTQQSGPRVGAFNSATDSQSSVIKQLVFFQSCDFILVTIWLEKIVPVCRAE